MKLWTNDERMVRTAVRTIVLSICKVDEPAVRSFVARSQTLPKQLNASLRNDANALLHTIRRRMLHRTPTGQHLGGMDAALQRLLDEIYFVNDLLEAGVEPLSQRILSSLLAHFLLPLIISPLVGGITHWQCQRSSSSSSRPGSAPSSPSSKSRAILQPTSPPPPSPLSAAILAAASGSPPPPSPPIRCRGCRRSD